MRSGSMMVMAVVSVMVLLLVGTVVVAGAFSSKPYADLVPAPDSIKWEQADETTVWLSTNQDGVEVRVSSVAVGIGDLRRFVSGSVASSRLGRGEGCLDHAVTELRVSSIGDDTTTTKKIVLIEGNVERGQTVSTASVSVHLRIYPEGGVPPATLSAGNINAFAASAVFEVPPAGGRYSGTVSGGETHFPDPAISTSLLPEFKIPALSGRWRIDASYSEHFPVAATLSIAGDVGASHITWTRAEAEAEKVVISPDVGVGLIACTVATDVAISLHSSDGIEFARYLVNIVTDSHISAAVGAMPSPAPKEQRDIRVCVDSTDARANYLDGWEKVGAPITDSDFSPGGALVNVVLRDIGDHNYSYFFALGAEANNARQLYVTPAGASNTSGLDADRVYPIALVIPGIATITTITTHGTISSDDDTATEAGNSPVITTAHGDTRTGETYANTTTADTTVSITRGIWLDAHALSPADDGLCS